MTPHLQVSLENGANFFSNSKTFPPIEPFPKLRRYNLPGMRCIFLLWSARVRLSVGRVRGDPDIRAQHDVITSRNLCREWRVTAEGTGGQFGLKISARKTQLSELYCRPNCRSGGGGGGGMIEAERGERP